MKNFNELRYVEFNGNYRLVVHPDNEKILLTYTEINTFTKMSKLSNDVLIWLKQNNIVVQFDRNSRIIDFVSKDDALKFKLAWG